MIYLFIAHLLYSTWMYAIIAYLPIIPGCLHLLPTYFTWMYAFIAHLLYLDVCISFPPIKPGCMHLLPTYYSWTFEIIAYLLPPFTAPLLCQDFLPTCFACIYRLPVVPIYCLPVAPKPGFGAL